MFKQKLPGEFITYAASILGETSFGLSGTQIIKITTRYAAELGIDIPNKTYPWGMANKATALGENLAAFHDKQQFQIIKEMCSIVDNEESSRLLLLMIKRFGHLDPGSNPDSVNDELIEQTRHWLSSFPRVLEIYNGAMEKQKHGIYQRNILDDLRLALELLLKDILSNQKSLENQLPLLGAFMKSKNASSELTNMFLKLLDYYTKYQNTYVKHEDAVNEEEIIFICEITSSFMRHFLRLNSK